jgi:hypothetical protein
VAVDSGAGGSGSSVAVDSSGGGVAVDSSGSRFR